MDSSTNHIALLHTRYASCFFPLAAWTILHDKLLSNSLRRHTYFAISSRATTTRSSFPFFFFRSRLVTYNRNAVASYGRKYAIPRSTSCDLASCAPVSQIPLSTILCYIPSPQLSDPSAQLWLDIFSSTKQAEIGFFTSVQGISNSCDCQTHFHPNRDDTECRRKLSSRLHDLRYIWTCLLNSSDVLVLGIEIRPKPNGCPGKLPDSIHRISLAPVHAGSAVSVTTCL